MEIAKGQIWRQEKRLETDYNFFSKENKEHRISGRSEATNKNKKGERIRDTENEIKGEIVIGDMQVSEVKGYEMIIKNEGMKEEFMEKGEWRQKERDRKGSGLRMDGEGEKNLYYLELLEEENEKGEGEMREGVKKDKNEEEIVEGIRMMTLKRNGEQIGIGEEEFQRKRAKIEMIKELTEKEYVEMYIIREEGRSVNQKNEVRSERMRRRIVARRRRNKKENDRGEGEGKL